MAQGGGLADASVGGEYAQARIGDELTEGAFEVFESGALVEEGFALGIFGKRMAGKTKALAIHCWIIPPFSRFSWWWSAGPPGGRGRSARLRSRRADRGRWAGRPGPFRHASAAFGAKHSR